MKKITKAILPVAGMGTRFFPATKTNPKEMFPIVDKPLIQYAAEEAISAGINELIFIEAPTKRSIKDHFVKTYELEDELKKRGKEKELQILKSIIPDNITCTYIPQPEPLGLGHAVLCAKSVIGDSSFIVLLPDDLIDSDLKGVTEQLIDKYIDKEKCIIAVEEIPKIESDKYGIVGIEKTNDNKLHRITSIIEKPKPEEAISSFGVVGRYLLKPRIFDYLEKTQKDKNGEIQLTDAISQLIKKEDAYSYIFDGVRYDCGSKVGYIQASIHYALKNNETKSKIYEYIQSVSK